MSTWLDDGSSWPVSRNRCLEFVHQALLDWLQHRQAARPHTPNRHVLVSNVTATIQSRPEAEQLR